jgi:hypothetical protein
MPENPDLTTYIENYFPFKSHAQTLLMGFSRFPNQFNLRFETFLDDDEFQSVPRKPSFEPLNFPYTLKDSADDENVKPFTDFMSANQANILSLDNRIKEITPLNTLGTTFDYYSVDGVNKVLIVKAKPIAGTEIDVLTYTGERFDAIMQNPANQPDFINAQMMCWTYGASVNDYLKILLKHKLEELAAAAQN